MKDTYNSLIFCSLKWSYLVNSVIVETLLAKRNYLFLSLAIALVISFGCERPDNQDSSVDNQDSSKKEFIYPNTIGTTWTYSHAYSVYYLMGGNSEKELREGTHTWQVIDRTIKLDGVSCTLRDIRYENVHLHNEDFSGYVTLDTVFTTLDTLYFTLDISLQTISIDWLSTLAPGFVQNPSALIRIPRYSSAATDTVRMSTTFRSARYVNNTGLLDFRMEQAGNHHYTEQFSLTSFHPIN